MLTKRFFAALATFSLPIIVLTAITKLVQKDINTDLNELEKKQSSSFKEGRETNQQIFNYIMNSTKNNQQDFFTGLEKEMRDLETMRNKNIENNNINNNKQVNSSNNKQQNNSNNSNSNNNNNNTK